MSVKNIDEMKKKPKNNIILIGMPSSGKSTIGKALAERLNADFIDTDSLLRESQKMDLKDIVINFGHKHFLRVQEEEILRINVEKCIIATGGSVIYSKNTMDHLKSLGCIVYLQIPIEELKARIKTERRFAKRSDQSFSELYNERIPLYERYSDFTVNCANKSVDAIVDNIIDILKLKMGK